jgi:hypothetical protein
MSKGVTDDLWHRATLTGRLYSEFVRGCDLRILKGAGRASRRLPPDVATVNQYKWFLRALP